MPSEYAQRYVEALIEAVAKDPNAVEVVGEVGAESHVAVYLELGPGHYLGTTAGVSERSRAVEGGLQRFELCALTSGHSPSVLSFLSELAMYMHGPTPKPFLPHETVQVSKEERLLLVPRWRLVVPDRSPVDVVEPLPISDADWDELASLSLADRAAWTRALGPGSPERWKALFPKL